MCKNASTHLQQPFGPVVAPVGIGANLGYRLRLGLHWWWYLEPSEDERIK